LQFSKVKKKLMNNSYEFLILLELIEVSFNLAKLGIVQLN